MESYKDEREIRAARNQSMFRAINEKITELNFAVDDWSRTYVVACECADTRCVASLEITQEAYAAVRREPHRFVVLPGHVYPEVEHVVEEFDNYVVVEKERAAAEVAEALADGSGDAPEA